MDFSVNVLEILTPKSLELEHNENGDDDNDLAQTSTHENVVDENDLAQSPAHENVVDDNDLAQTSGHERSDLLRTF